MDQALFFLVMLAGVTHVAEATCQNTENTSVCSVTVGGSLYIPVIFNVSGHQVWCKKQLPSGTINVFTLKKKLTIYEPFINRAEFFINNGTFEMSDVKMNDSGQYIIEAFDSKGVNVKEIYVQLEVKEKPFCIWIPVTGGVVALVLPFVLLIFFYMCCCRKKSDSRM